MYPMLACCMFHVEIGTVLIHYWNITVLARFSFYTTLDILPVFWPRRRFKRCYSKPKASPAAIIALGYSGVLPSHPAPLLSNRAVKPSGFSRGESSRTRVTCDVGIPQLCPAGSPPSTDHVMPTSRRSGFGMWPAPLSLH